MHCAFYQFFFLTLVKRSAVNYVLFKEVFLILGRFCRRHRLRTGENVPSVPRDLLLMSEMVLPRFIISIIQYLRDGYTESGEAHQSNSCTCKTNLCLKKKKLSINVCEVNHVATVFQKLLQTEICRKSFSSWSPRSLFWKTSLKWVEPCAQSSQRS